MSGASSSVEHDDDLLLALVEDDALPLHERFRAIKRMELSQLKLYLRERNVDWASVWMTATHDATSELSLRGVLQQRVLQCAQECVEESEVPPVRPSPSTPPQALPQLLPVALPAQQHGMAIPRPQQPISMPSQQPIPMPQPFAMPQLPVAMPQPLVTMPQPPVAMAQPLVAMPQQQPAAVVQPFASQHVLVPLGHAQHLWERFWSRRWAPSWLVPPTSPLSADGYGSCPGGAASHQPSIPPSPPSPPWLHSEASPILPTELAQSRAHYMYFLFAALPVLASLFMPIMGSSWSCPLLFVTVFSICILASSRLEVKLLTLVATLGPVLGACFPFAFMPNWTWSFEDFVLCNLLTVVINVAHTLYVPVSATARRCIPFFPTVLAFSPNRDVELHTRFLVFMCTSICSLIICESRILNRALATPWRRCEGVEY